MLRLFIEKNFEKEKERQIFMLSIFLFVFLFLLFDLKSFNYMVSIAGVGEDATPFSGLLHFTLDPYIIMLSVKQGGIKYYFLSFWYDSTWDWTQTIGEHSTH